MTSFRFSPMSRRDVLWLGASSLVASVADAAAPSWPEAAPAAPGSRLAEALDAAAPVGVLRAIAVAHDGRLVAERVFREASPETLLRINSATKSVTSLLVGIALGHGRLRSLSQTLGELLPEALAAQPDSAARDVTLGQVLTGTTGLSYDWTRQFRALGAATDPVQFAFALPREAPPGAAWTYNDPAVGLLGPILERAYGMALPEAARVHLFEPLGIDAFEWQRDASGRAIAYGGLRLRIRDLLKIAWLAVDGGTWRGTRVVPAAWVAESTRRHVGGAWPNPPVEDSGYGFLWFTGTYKGVPVAWAWGFGAQLALLAPSLRLAVATAATEPSPSQLAAHNQAVASVVGRILDAVRA